MNTYEINIEALSKRREYEYILKELESFEDTDSDVSIGVEEVEGKKVLFSIKDSKTYLLDSLYSSEKFLDSWIKGAQIKWDSKFFVTGFGNGMIIRKILSCIDKESLVFVYEPSLAIMKTVFENFDVSDILSNRKVILFVAGYDKVGISIHNTVCGMISYRDIFNARILKYPNYSILFPEQVKKFDEEMNQAAATISTNTNTYGRFGHFFIKNSIRNAVLLTKAKRFSDLPVHIDTNVPGILVSCGPSLDKNVEFLKRAKGKAVIIAGDSSVKPMVRHGIYPDIYITVDMNKPLDIFDVEGIYDIPAVAVMDGTYAVLKNQKAPLFMFATEDEYINDYMAKRGIEFSSLATGGCEATSALSFLMALGLRKIIVVGQDLAYTGGTVYASNSAGATWDQQKLIDNDNCITEGIDGKPILTSKQFNTYKHWFERQIEYYDDLELINATEGGARIHGAREMTLNEAIDEYCNTTFDVAKAIDSCGDFLPSEYTESFADYMREIPNQIELIKSIILEGLKIHDALENEIRKPTIDGAVLKELLKRNQQNIVEINSYRCLYYVECIVMDEMKLLNQDSVTGEMENMEELKSVIKNARLRYELLLEGIDRFIKMWKEIENERF